MPFCPRQHGEDRTAAGEEPNPGPTADDTTATESRSDDSPAPETTDSSTPEDATDHA